jgi:3-oxoacyl-[acyl-carrier-protein] synthase-1
MTRTWTDLSSRRRWRAGSREYGRRARRAKIYGEIVGGATSDGHDMVAPSGEGAARCMRQAVKGVKVPIDYINPHATSTPIGDLREIEAIREVFGSGDKCPPISATKSLTGHSQGATGAHEAIYSLLMMQNGFICESAHIDELDPAFSDMPIVRVRRDNVNLRAALSTHSALAYERNARVQARGHLRTRVSPRTPRTRPHKLLKTKSKSAL